MMFLGRGRILATFRKLVHPLARQNVHVPAVSVRVENPLLPHVERPAAVVEDFIGILLEHLPEERRQVLVVALGGLEAALGGGTGVELEALVPVSGERRQVAAGRDVVTQAAAGGIGLVAAWAEFLCFDAHRMLDLRAQKTPSRTWQPMFPREPLPKSYQPCQSCGCSPAW